ncbi:ATP-binding cassette domain-containing protein [Rhodobacteraceae bacterium 2CG4]|uniref:ATP-binding cassette domain-containing protein n=1 Tax=Halovulum marinum TaxID=2662447 RepID=A0A6L5YVK7_9RHOB|nr:ABC transporter ATP-binding protein [Halovulum marinum]MSU88331.1 ATP-binding cassette domain-containing protein [Halovulum marinum]
MLDVQNLTKRYGALTILDGVSLTLGAGETMALVGESGSGKSTLLHLIAGLDAPDAGRVVLDGRELAALDDAGRAAARRDLVGLVFQQFNLVQSLTVAQNIALQARLAGRHDAGRAARLSERLGLTGLEARFPEQLSGGQQQRVAIARALAAAPPLLLADEPTGNLDEATGDRVMDLLLELVAEAGMALILVTHSPRLAGRLRRVERLHAGRLE